MKKEFVFRFAIVVVIALLVYQFGIKPIYFKDKADGWASGQLNKQNANFDVIVVGAEPEGIAAAVSAARIGAKTLLISQGKDLGGIVSNSFITDLEINYGNQYQMLNKGIFKEFYNKLGKEFSIDKYLTFANNLVKDEKNLHIIYNSQIETPILESNTLIGINILEDGVKTEYYGERFIDSSREGVLLNACGVFYFSGAEDLNLKQSFLPVKLNFEVSGVTPTHINCVLSDKLLKSVIDKYETSNLNIKINNLNIVPEAGDKAIVQGIEIYNLDMTNEKAVEKAYGNAEYEAKDLANYLQAKFIEFKKLKFDRVAKEFYSKGEKHFAGEYTLSVKDILENADFSDKIALGSYPIDGSNFADYSSYIVGKPVQYSIPLGCIVPLKIDNLLMVGSKASYSSLASSSAGSISVGITTGESAGVVAVYSIVKGITPREIVKQKDPDRIKELEELFLRQGIYLPDFKIENVNTKQWSFDSIEQLCSLGLIAGGMDNNYLVSREATKEDLAMLLLNGIYRLSSDKYSLELDLRLRSFFMSEDLSKEIKSKASSEKYQLNTESAGEILLAMYNVPYESGKAYQIACEKGYINNVLQQKLSNIKTLKMEDVFYLAAYNIKYFTGKDI